MTQPSNERELDAQEVEEVYAAICNAKLKPVDIYREAKFSEFMYELNGKLYRLVYDPSGDYFCDIIFEEDLPVE